MSMSIPIGIGDTFGDGGAVTNSSFLSDEITMRAKGSPISNPIVVISSTEILVSLTSSTLCGLLSGLIFTSVNDRVLEE